MLLPASSRRSSSENVGQDGIQDGILRDGWQPSQRPPGRLSPAPRGIMAPNSHPAPAQADYQSAGPGGYPFHPAPHARLGEILLDRGKIEPDDLDRALELQKE